MASGCVWVFIDSQPVFYGSKIVVTNTPYLEAWIEVEIGSEK